MKGFRRSKLKVPFAITILCLFTLGLQAQPQGGGDLVFLSDLSAPGIYVAPADTLNFTLIPGLDDRAHVQSPAHVDYDPVDGMVYWTDTQRRTISRACLNGTGIEVVITNSVAGMYGMSLDVKNRMVYWTNSGNIIERASLDGQNRERVPNLSFSSPRAVLVDPINSHLYWTEVRDGPRIQRSATNGTGSIVLVNTDLTWPYSLALDLQVCSLSCSNGGTLDLQTCQCSCAQSWSGATCSTCLLTADSCLSGGIFSAEYCECVCPDGISGVRCNVDDPCVATPGLCSESGQYCLADSYSQSPAGYRCECRELDGYFYDSVTESCTQNGFKSFTIVLVVVRVNGTNVDFLREYTDPNSGASRTFSQIVDVVVKFVLLQNSSTSDIELLNGVFVSEGSVVFTGVVRAPVSSPVTASAVQEVLATQAASGPLTDWQTILNVDPAVTATDSTTACSPTYCQNEGTCSVSGQYPQLVYSCRCSTGFTGSECESVIPVPTDEPATTSNVTPTPAATTTGWSTQGSPSAVTIAVLCVVVVIVIAIVLALYIYYKRAQKRGRRHTAKPHTDNNGAQELHTYMNEITPDDEESQPTSLGHEAVGGPFRNDVVDCADSSSIYEDVGLPSWAKPWSVPWGNFMVGTKVLYDGFFGEVRLGSVMIHEDVTKAAIKTLKSNASPTEGENFIKELETLTQLGRHPNVVGLLGICQHEDVLYVALEYLPVGDLRSYLRNARSMELDSQMALVSKRLILFALDVAKGMQHFATSGVIHRDLAARNIFLSDDLVAKVSNFGLSRGEDIYVQKSKGRVPIRWLSLESLFSKTYSTMSDVWSFGILLWEITTLGGTPYEGINSKDLPSRLKNGYRMPKPINCDDQIYDLMQQCWQEDPKDRPTFKKLVSVLTTMANNSRTYIWLLPKAENYMYLMIRPEMDDN